MIRFITRQYILKNDLNVIMAPESVLADESLWDDGKAYFKQNVSNDAADIRLLPVIDGKQDVICYAYQDAEANRELRMLKELDKNREILQFHDIFPEIREVIVCGCNELAFYFVKYLEKRQIPVKVVGKYWEYFGYKSLANIDVGNGNEMVVCAEELVPVTGDLYQVIIRSVSSAFECIDKIYEANVLEGKIKDTEGSLEEFLESLEGREVILLGTDERTQDTYDFLYGYGIDIKCFAEWQDTNKQGTNRTLLGKNVVDIKEAINGKADDIFINCNDKNSALGTESLELFSYYGYRRNEQFFLMQDYTGVPYNNLLHVLKGKRVLLAGDEQLCAMMAEYLSEKEKGDVYPTYVSLKQCVAMEETDILCVINPWFDLETLRMEENPEVWYFWKTLSEKEIVSYTNYFSQVRVLVDVDLYRNRGRKKYAIQDLKPKGILLGRIPTYSGNIFFRGILDGHPDVLEWGFTPLNNNLLLYCIRLSGEKSENILKSFKKMCDIEFAFHFEHEFICWDEFEKSAKRLLSLKESFTSQELFVIFHISFAQMLCGYQITDLNQKIIYWEPHMLPREDFPFLARWLEDKQIHGQTVCIHRDMVVRAGSVYNYYQRHGMAGAHPAVNIAEIMEETTDQYWEEFHMRFEEIKLHPQKELRKLCGRLGIPWSDTMLRVTKYGRTWNWDNHGILDFDIKPVFNKYEEWLSEFDRLRISLTNSLYQKKYGYTYESCLNFSRKELQEMFLKEFRFQKKLWFSKEKDRTAYFLRTYKILTNQLWEVRKYTILNEIEPIFEEVEIGESASVRRKKGKAEIISPKELNRLLEFVRKQERLVLYGTGRDCEGLLKHLDKGEQSKLLFSDLRAEYTEVIFHGRKVIAPRELCGAYQDYKILITSSQFYENMRQWLENRGITKERIICNTFQLWKEEG